jgi:uncharacterized repeat protein (TIGR03803 family)
MEASMRRVHRLQWVLAVFLFCAATATSLRAQTFTTLASFDKTDGKYPVNVALVQGFDGNFYGTTNAGGAGNGSNGTVFKITPEGTLTRLYSFCRIAQCADGKNPQASLLQATNGKFYGETTSGGASGSDGCGTIFEITAAGKLTTLHSFEDTDGCIPLGGLIQTGNGDFYGTTQVGGANGAGTVFKITAAGTLTTLYNFCSRTNCTDGERPVASLVQATDGDFYGTTGSGGGHHNSEFCASTGCGTFFRINPAGKLTTLYRFCSLTNCADGAGPGMLVQAADGNFYGVTGLGGPNCPTGFPCGTVFEITPTGTLTTLYTFCSLTNCADGSQPGGVMQATDGNFYGITATGGTGGGNNGTIFEITPTGTLTTLYSFCSLTNCTDGAGGQGGLLQATNGSFYGATGLGGTSNDGTIFSLTTGLGPFVSFVGNPAKVGQSFDILGQGLTGTTSVSLNGTPVTFTFKSDTLLTATVPAGATTGSVTVSTPSGTLMSNVPFQVIP